VKPAPLKFGKTAPISDHSLGGRNPGDKPERRLMPWSNQSGGGGPWKGGGGQGPWGQGPRGSGGPTPPDLEQLLRRSQEGLKRVLPGGGGGGDGAGRLFGGIIALLVAAAVVWFGFIYKVGAGQQGVVLRFGEFNRMTPVFAGYSFRLPYPIETVYTPNVQAPTRLTVGFADRVGGGSQIDVPGESLMLTGDENIVDVDFVVLWVIGNPREYLFNLQSPAQTVKAVAESAMREVVGRNNIQPLLTDLREQVQREVQQLMQATLDDYKAGINVTDVTLQKVDPPTDVIAAFRDLQAARANQEQAQNEAQRYANEVVPRARGDASQITESANAYRDQIIAEARGRADRFIKVYDEYKLAPDVTRRRIYLETMEDVFSKVNKVIIDQKGPGVVPFLPLNDARNPLAPAQPPAPTGPGPRVTTGGARP
jgi:membrane protease subunit HflK